MSEQQASSSTKNNNGVVLFNYASSDFGTTIECNYPSTTGFEIERLISNKNNTDNPIHNGALDTKRTAFLAESFSRPPVEVTISFAHMISLASLMINPHVRSFVIKSVMVSVEGPTGRQTTIGRLEFSPNAHPAILYNQALDPRILRQSIGIDTDTNAANYTWMAISASPWILHNVTRMKIRIFAMHDQQPFGLGEIGVWAQPSQKLQNDERVRIWNTLLQQQSAIRANRQHKALRDERTPPAEFIDVITQNIMSDPVVLPSNHICDKSTIIRHLEHHQTDPFTGLPLNYKDIKADIVLQNRIRNWNNAGL